MRRPSCDSSDLRGSFLQLACTYGRDVRKSSPPPDSGRGLSFCLIPHSVPAHGTVHITGHAVKCQPSNWSSTNCGSGWNWRPRKRRQKHRYDPTCRGPNVVERIGLVRTQAAAAWAGWNVRVPRGRPTADGASLTVVSRRPPTTSADRVRRAHAMGSKSCSGRRRLFVASTLNNKCRPVDSDTGRRCDRPHFGCRYRSCCRAA